MKQMALIIIIFTISMIHSVTAADVVDNPAEPITSPNAKKIGRTVKMTESTSGAMIAGSATANSGGASIRTRSYSRRAS